MNRAYVTVLSNDCYYKGVVAFQKSLQKTRTKFPLVIVVTDEVSHYVIDRLILAGG